MVNNFKKLIVYQKAHKLAVGIYNVSLKFPKEETYSLTDQIRRSSRSVSACIAESWAKRKYEKVFVNKLTDALPHSSPLTPHSSPLRSSDFGTSDLFAIE